MTVKNLNPSTMQSMRMKRVELLEALTKNLADHRQTFLEAQKGYRTQMIKELDQMLQDATNNKRIKRGVSMPEPEDHSKDYETAIRMLSMCVDEELEIEMDDFGRYVMDDWGWKTRWSETVSNYR